MSTWASLMYWVLWLGHREIGMDLYFTWRLLESAQIFIEAETTTLLTFTPNGIVLLNTRDTHCEFVKCPEDVRQLHLNPEIYKSYSSLCSCSQLAHNLEEADR